MVYFEDCGQPYLVLGSFRRTNDLFDKRSGTYAGRPKFSLLHLFSILFMSDEGWLNTYYFRMGWDYNLAMNPYGDHWRRQRRAFHQHFHSNKVQIYEGSQVRGTRGLLRRLLETPDNFWEHVRQSVSIPYLSARNVNSPN